MEASGDSDDPEHDDGGSDGGDGPPPPPGGGAAEPPLEAGPLAPPLALAPGAAEPLLAPPLALAPGAAEPPPAPPPLPPPADAPPLAPGAAQPPLALPTTSGGTATAGRASRRDHGPRHERSHRWGPRDLFDLIYRPAAKGRKYGGWQAVCPYHRKNATTLCTKTLSIGKPGKEGEQETLVMLKAQAK